MTKLKDTAENAEAVNRKMNTYNAKLTVEQVKEIKRALLDEDVVYARLARKYGITQTQLNRIRKGESWGTVTID